MNSENTIDLFIHNRTFQVTCPESEIEILRGLAACLDRKMRFMANTRDIIGLDRLAIIAALNVLHESSKKENSLAINTLDNRIDQLCQKVEIALNLQEEFEL